MISHVTVGADDIAQAERFYSAFLLALGTPAHGGRKRRVWRKIHIGIDEQTLEIRAVEIAGSNTGDGETGAAGSAKCLS